MSIKKKALIVIGSIVAAVLVMAVFFHEQYDRAEVSDWGLSYSQQRAVELGFDPIEMYIDMMAELRPKKIRLMTYWEEIEPNRGEFNFNQVDRLLLLAEKTGTEVILVVGKKQPRWPECHEPQWAMDLPQAEEEEARLSMIKNAVEHFKSFPAIKIWQVENEPLFKFGETCPKMDRDLLKREIALVKSLDSRPVLVTDAGELGRWIPAATTGADLFGSTMYFVVHNRITGYFKYPAVPAMFRIKAGVLAFFTPIKKVMGVELQGEPWLADGVLGTDLEVQKSLMNPKVFKEYTSFAKEVGFTDNYLWGVEWWYWMAKKHNDWGMWNAAKELLSSDQSSGN